MSGTTPMRHIVLGAGGIGRATADLLAGTGDQVVMVSRSGRDSRTPGVRSVALDVTRTDELSALAEGAASVVNALNPKEYTNWPNDWPPMAQAVLQASERAGARLVTISNTYLYGRVSGPVTESTPIAPNGPKGVVRAEMWQQALARHGSGGLQVTEVRATDYLGPHTLATSMLSGMILTALLDGRTAWLPMGGRTIPHTYTHDGDVAALAAELARSDQAADFGRPWHVPSAPPVTIEEILTIVGTLAGRPLGRLRILPRVGLSASAAFVPIMRELRETRHQFDQPFIVDGSAATRRFGLQATPVAESLAQTVAAIRAAKTASAA